MAIVESKEGEIALRDVSITERLFEGLSLRRDAPVLIDGPSGREVTGGALMDGIKRLAGGLNARGLGAGQTVALMAPNIPEFCTVFHGVAWAGGTVTTINPTYTFHEVRQQLLDSGAVALVTISAFLEAAQKAAEGTGVREIILIDGGEGGTALADLMGAPQERQTPVDLDEHIVVLPYSSGTTGLPKGVMLSHRNLVVNVDQVIAMAKFDGGEVTVGFLPFFHIYGLTVLMNLYLSTGGTLVTVPRFDLEQFLQLAQDHKVKRLWVVPPVALGLAKHPVVDQYDLSSVEIVFSGAAPLGADLSAALARRLGCEVMQGYGMTELSPVSHASVSGSARAGSAGQTVPGTACRIIDANTGEELGPNTEGELWVKGPQVMKGYLNNPAATDDCLDENGWLRTGDLACFDEDGYLYVRDRVKELIKYKGFQVAPAELEDVLLSIPGVLDAAVIGAPDAEAGEVPVAFVVSAPDAAPDEAAIRAHFAEYLAHYKQLHRIEFIETIPKSASGKILRRALRGR